MADAGSLLTSVRAVRDRVAAALAAGEPPFADPAAVFGGTPGVSGPVAERMARLHADIAAEKYDGGKLAVLVAATAAAAALESQPADPPRLAAAVRVAGGTAVEAVSRHPLLLRHADQVRQVIRTAVGGRDELADALLDAFAGAGPDGVIHVVPDPDGRPGCRAVAVGDDPTDITVFVRGTTADETADLERWGCNGMHAGRHAIARGVLPGGGVAYRQAAESLRAEADDDTVTAAAARAVIAGLEAPAAALAGRGGSGLLDPLGVVRGAIRSGTAAAADLIEMG